MMQWYEIIADAAGGVDVLIRAISAEAEWWSFNTVSADNRTISHYPDIQDLQAIEGPVCICVVC